MVNWSPAVHIWMMRYSLLKIINYTLELLAKHAVFVVSKLHKVASGCDKGKCDKCIQLS